MWGSIGYFFNIIFTFPIFNVLMLLDHIFGDFALSIIVLTLVVRLCLFPLTLKQLRSTKATQAIQPLMAEIKRKYPDQREQMVEMQRLYKEYNINPMAGCLPLLFQMPILYGMYGAMRLILTPADTHTKLLDQINQVVYPFLPKFTTMPDLHLRWFAIFDPHWILNLGAPDPTHILPILAGLATFVQMRMSQARAAQQQKTSDAPKNKQQDMMTQQMQMMSFVMPFVTLFIAWNFPAGLALYWTTTSVFSMVQQYFVTGWGSLFSLPGLGGNKSEKNQGYTLATAKGPKRGATIDSTIEVATEQGGSSANNPYANPTGSSNRRRRPNSASARRRGSSAPRRNPSRS